MTWYYKCNKHGQDFNHSHYLNTSESHIKESCKHCKTLISGEDPSVTHLTYAHLYERESTCVHSHSKNLQSVVVAIDVMRESAL